MLSQGRTNRHSHRKRVHARRNHAGVENVTVVFVPQGMDAVCNRVILQSNKFMVLIGADVDHMWRYELADNAFNRDLESAFGKQRQVVKLMRVAVLDVARAPKVHHARV